MSAPGPPWTPEEDGLLRSMGAAGESATAIATAQAQSGGGAPASSPTRDQVGPFAARAEAKVEITTCTAPGTLGLEAMLSVQLRRYGFAS